MKKIVSVAILVSMLLSLVSVPAGALKSDFSFLVAESYNDQTTGNSPGNKAVAGGAAKVVVTEEKKAQAV